MIAIPLIPLGLVLALMLGGQLRGSAQSAPACGDHATQERMRAMMLEATDEAFKEQIVSLHGVWLRDATDQPQRAAIGVTRSVDAYLHARKAVTDWRLKPC